MTIFRVVDLFFEGQRFPCVPSHQHHPRVIPGFIRNEYPVWDYGTRRLIVPRELVLCIDFTDARLGSKFDDDFVL